MRKLTIAGLAFLALPLLAAPAHAFTVDKTTGMNDDGSAKFADPDEQTPFGVTSGAGVNSQPGGGVTIPGLGGGSLNFSSQSGASSGGSADDAFDRAYAHIGDNK